jgi:hypothetical protein
LKEFIKFQKGKPRWDLENLHAQQQKIKDTLEKNLYVTEWESGNVEVQRNNIKKCVLDTVTDLVGKTGKQESHGLHRKWPIKWMNEGNEECKKWRRKNYRRLRKELNRATDKATNEYRDSVCDKITEFKRRGHYDLMYMKMKKIGWKENHGIQNTGNEDSKWK